VGILVVLASLIPQDVNPQSKGHLVGALNNGATEEEVETVRAVVIKVCEASGMRRLEEGGLDGWGWRDEVAQVKPPKEKI
jgi:alkylhydroperoxidase/carboxymuconolactone decarboxylase family protein YurZ